MVVEKSKSSAFAGTNRETLLMEAGCSRFVLVGFTANECISATAQDSAAKGFDAVVVGDATATFDLREDSGRLVKADRLLRMTMVNIHALYAKVAQTKEIMMGGVV